MHKTYQETLAYLYTQLPMYQRMGKKAFKKDLGNIMALCQALGNPQNHFKSIHLAGTNGKGSTAHILASVLQAGGLKVGLYTSPHYRDFRERIKINGEFVSEEWIVNFVEKNQKLLQKIKPSFFEITVAMAFQYFADQKLDIAIIETGLGGRLDSTNIIHPILSIITNISLDHQDMLGDTLELIAGEKAGIIKNRVPVVIGETHEETQPVFLKKAKEEKAPIYFADQEYQLIKQKQTAFHISYRLKQARLLGIKSIKVNLTGEYQALNVATALKAFELLTPFYKAAINISSIKKGLLNLQEETCFMGRWQKLGEQPLIICDSAHNEGGLKLVMQQLNKVKYGQLHIVMGMVNDKSPDMILGLFPKKAKYYFCKANIPRGLSAKKLKEVASKFQLRGRAYVSVKNAIAAAQRNAEQEDLIFIGGSIFVVGEGLDEFLS